MRTEFQIQLTSQLWLNYMIHRYYTNVFGILTVPVGIICLMLGVQDITNPAAAGNNWVGYVEILAAFLMLIGIPVSMWLDGKQRAKKDLSFLEKVSYTLEESGISAKSSQGERKVGWQEIQKVTATGQQVILLFGKRRVILLPKKQMGVKYIPALQIISAYTAPEKVKIRGI